MMAVDPNIASVAALIGEPARAAMLTALLGRRPLVASELARCAGISPQTGSAHLAQLVAGGLLSVTPNGRHRYYRLAGPHVAEVLEALAALAPAAPIHSLRQFDEARAIRFARTCYDHLAGVVGVALTEQMLERGILLHAEHTYRVGDEGVAWLKREGLDAHQILHGRRAQARACLDWSERRDHLAGAFGAAVTEWLFQRGWIACVANNRAVRLTEAGHAGFLREWGLQFTSVSAR
jgi:DNA-binding transcriptional ArsR family regulator